jgi:hypothetical protein
MRLTFAAPFMAFAVLVLAGCGGQPNEYPVSARTQFERSCPPDSDVCACTWDRLTRTLTYEEYQAALDRFRSDGLMDPRVTRARTLCLEKHDT